jgi:four helix bundle protein
MNEKEFQKLTRDFARDVMLFASELPSDRLGTAIGNQLKRSGASVGANFRSACRARSKADMASKLGIVVEEADEVQYWLEMMVETRIRPAETIKDLHFTAKPNSESMCRQHQDFAQRNGYRP